MHENILHLFQFFSVESPNVAEVEAFLKSKNVTAHALLQELSTLPLREIPAGSPTVVSPGENFEQVLQRTIDFLVNTVDRAHDEELVKTFCENILGESAVSSFGVYARLYFLNAIFQKNNGCDLFLKTCLSHIKKYLSDHFGAQTFDEHSINEWNMFGLAGLCNLLVMHTKNEKLMDLFKGMVSDANLIQHTQDRLTMMVAVQNALNEFSKTGSITPISETQSNEILVCLEPLMIDSCLFRLFSSINPHHKRNMARFVIELTLSSSSRVGPDAEGEREQMENVSHIDILYGFFIRDGAPFASMILEFFKDSVKKQQITKLLVDALNKCHLSGSCHASPQAIEQLWKLINTAPSSSVEFSKIFFISELVKLENFNSAIEVLSSIDQSNINITLNVGSRNFACVVNTIQALGNNSNKERAKDFLARFLDKLNPILTSEICRQLCGYATYFQNYEELCDILPQYNDPFLEQAGPSRRQSILWRAAAGFRHFAGRVQDIVRGDRGESPEPVLPPDPELLRVFQLETGWDEEDEAEAVVSIPLPDRRAPLTLSGASSSSIENNSQTPSVEGSPPHLRSPERQTSSDAEEEASADNRPSLC